MKKVVLIAFLLLAAIAASAQQVITSENISSYNTIDITGKMQVELIPSDTNKVHFVLTDVNIKKFRWSVDKGVLKINFAVSQVGEGTARATIYYADTLEKITISGVELIAEEPITGNMLVFSAGGGSTVTANFNVDELELAVTGNSAGVFSGYARYFGLHAADRSKVNAQKVENLSAVVHAGSGAEVHVTAYERLVTNAKSSSTVFYRGKPLIFRDITSRVSSGMMGSSVLNVGETRGDSFDNLPK